jgi:hypothetical protein
VKTKNCQPKIERFWISPWFSQGRLLFQIPVNPPYLSTLSNHKQRYFTFDPEFLRVIHSFKLPCKHPGHCSTQKGERDICAFHLKLLRVIVIQEEEKKEREREIPPFTLSFFRSSCHAKRKDST